MLCSRRLHVRVAVLAAVTILAGASLYESRRSLDLSTKSTLPLERSQEQDDRGLTDGCASYLQSASQYPRHYVAHAVSEPPTIDGKLDEKLWREVPWTEDFVDIAAGPTPRKKTRAKVRWDANFLYIGAYMEEDEIWANVTQHNDVIFKDNDFEVFVDPAGTTQYYKEFEVNALATTWSLCLNKPYSNGGYENSTRTFGDAGWGMPAEAATHINGALNDASRPATNWTVEIALPILDLLVNQTGATPQDGVYWRLGFSRVEWRVLRKGKSYWKDPAYPHEDNWVWQPMGEINMHLPERWGILEFADLHSSSARHMRDPTWPARFVAAALYDAGRAWAANHDGKFTDSLEELQTVAPSPGAFACGACHCEASVTVGGEGATYEARVSSMEGSIVATIHEDHLLTVTRS